MIAIGPKHENYKQIICKNIQRNLQTAVGRLNQV